VAKVPITVMGFRCERCSHEWVPRGGVEEEPRVCPKCRSPWWSRPKKSLMNYETFRDEISSVLASAGKPLTWTEIRTAANLPQAFPNNQWVHRMEKDIGLVRHRQKDGTIHWHLTSKELPLGEVGKSASPKATE
jgi:predicted Zn-ribbon and HTH transcriptional regulator